MIGHLEGNVLYIGETHAIVSAGGVGYKVFAAVDTLGGLSVGTRTSLWTHLAVRETALDLYGFATRTELSLFELLLGVTGIGPKSALGILSVATPSSLKSAIAEGNIAYLTKMSGIGKKTAEKIVIELRDKVGLAIEGEKAAHTGDTDAIEALEALGYSRSEARDALKLVPREHQGGSTRLREALKILGSAR